MFLPSMKRFLVMCMLITACLFEGSLEEEKLNELVDCSENYATDNLKSAVFVSTLDGRITALNAHAGGLVMWDVDTGPGPLLSSSIHKLELTNHGQWVRMIPSLSGALYKFNGVNLEMLPVSADHLLQSSSLLLNDGLVISGGRETRIYSIALETGELLYECSMKGCDNFKNMSDNAIVIQRHTQTVRAVDIHTGSERWNFSVGQHHVKLTTDAANCHMKEEDPRVQDFDVKAIMPEGLVYAVEKDRRDAILWKHKFSSPIVSVWRLDHGMIYNVNLFHDNLWSTFLQNSRSFSPILYLGMHQKQLYIQECVPQNSAERATHFIENESVESLQIPWDPFPVTSTALGLASRPPLNAAASATDDDNDAPTTALSVLYASEYVNGNGYYIFNRNKGGSQSSKQCSPGQEVNGSDVLSNHELKDALETPIHIFIVPAWCWWAEVLVISVITAVLVNLIVTQRVLQLLQIGIQETGKKEIVFIEKPVLRDVGLEAETSALPNYYGTSNPQITDFTSRYLMDFEPIQCLGKGGFGVVFEAKNKIDDCNYAIKRIALPNSLESRDRMLREVKALAKLEHQHIVRYFNAWMECPPPGWQEHQDSVYFQRCKAESTLLSGATLSDESVDSRYTNSGVNAMENTSLVEKFDHVDDKYEHNSSDLNDSYVVFEDSQLTNHEHSLSKSVDDSATNPRARHHMNRSLCSSGEKPKLSRRMYLYIQMQLCLKESLREWLSENVANRDRKTLLQMFEQIVQAVEYIHLKGLIHRDLKPSNIFFSVNGEIKVGDFGLVTAIMPTLTNDPFDPETSVDMNLKHTAQVGTQLYMSPEQVQGLPYDYKVDIYSLGVILFELLHPFSTQMERSNVLLALRRNNFPEIFKQQFHDEYDLLCLMLSHLPERRPTTFGIRARPPLSEYSSSKEPESVHSQWHFTLPLHSRNSSNPTFL